MRVTLNIVLPRGTHSHEQIGWIAIQKRAGEEIRWQSPNGNLEIAIEVVPRDGPGYEYAIITGNNRTDEYNYDNDAPTFRNLRAAKKWAARWMKRHRLEAIV